MSDKNLGIKKKRRFRHVIILSILLWPSLSKAQDDVLTLENAIQMALSRNERALQAGELVSAAEARVMRARAYFLPSINAAGSYTRRPFESIRIIGGQQVISQNYNALSGNAQVSLVLFDSRSIPTLRQASLDKTSQENAAADSKRKLAFEVSNAFLMTLSVDQVMEASKHRFEYARQALEAAKARFAAGLVSGNDVTRAELEHATAEMGITQVSGQVETTRLQLAYLLDEPDSGRKRLQAPEFLLKAAEDKPQAVEPLVVQAQNRRPDLISLRWRARAQHALVLEPTLKWLPTMTFNGQYRYTNEPGLTGKNFNWNVGLTVSWPIFDGLTRNADYKERKALAYMADLDVQSSERKVELDVRGAFVALNNAQASLKLATVAQNVALKNATETAELYRQGLSQALQVADANVRLFEAEVGLAQARFNLGIAYLNLEAALGLDPLGKESIIEY
jgi:outer membrane protein TolC